MARRKADAERPIDEPPMPSWWDDDEEEVTEDNMQAASTLGQHVAIT